MWAMQDYLQQYQQLVCQFRSENASLRRQLSELQSGTAVDRSIQSTPRTPITPPIRNEAPTQPNSASPTMDQPPPSAPAVESPDIPPLGQSNSRRAYNGLHMFAESAGDDHYAQLASHELPAAATESATSSDVLLSGEVVSNDNGGRRLIVDIESFNRSGRVAKFDGEVSLALLTSEGGVQHRLARWDFGPNEVAAAVNANATEPTMRFAIQLPSDTKVDGPTELWAKLAPSNGARLFSHAKVNLDKPGVFSSRTDKVWASEEAAVAASYAEIPAESATVDTPIESSETTEPPATFNESAWSTAQPGQPATLPVEPEGMSGGWRAASGPAPTIANKSEPLPRHRQELPKLPPAAPPKPAPTKVTQKPSWAPERPGTIPSHAARPTWSATR